jgi:hypothetical protein
MASFDNLVIVLLLEKLEQLHVLLEYESLLHQSLRAAVMWTVSTSVLAKGLSSH